MRNTMEYKGYVGSVEFSDEDALFFGQVIGLRALLSYEGENAQELAENFHSTVDDWIENKDRRNTPCKTACGWRSY